MIIACPECVGPFELRDGDIAELVQLECPHCRFRMIFDFAAANDASLREPGMRMASGYRSVADYRSAVAQPHVHAVPDVAEPEVAAPAAEVAVAVAAVEAPIATPPFEREIGAPEIILERETPSDTVLPPLEPERPAVAAALPRPSIALGDDDDMDSETIVRPSAPAMLETAPRTPASDVRATVPDLPTPADDGVRATVIGMPPPPGLAASAAAAAARTGDTVVRAMPTARDDAPAPRAPVAEVAAPRAPVAEPAPARPRTPAARTEAPRRELAPSEPAPAPRPTRQAAPPRPVPIDDIEPELDTPKRGMFGTVLVVILLLAAVALTVASVVRKGTPDPRPLLEDIYRQMKG
ncbi:MAG: hypothetical protein IPH07_02250 [Deltaproteobacteria bacterium]|nr:hypothetical protein [Deltaproteobacteria bacterium]MBK8718488.1 hypothetical protein [Deltaproteobacteria bacterium]MBP7288551.1 hypothetical protein [Nannocystaceae bacterium]